MSLPWPGPDTRRMRFPGPDDREMRFPGPDRRPILWPTAPTYAVAILASAFGVGSASATVVVAAILAVPASGTGVGTASVTGSTAITAAASGTGTATATFNPSEVDAEAVGTGTASATVLPSVAVTATASGSGTASATMQQAAIVAAAASGSGTASASVTVSTAVAAAATGTGTASATVTVGYVYTNPDTFNRTDASTLGSDWRVDRNSQPKIATNRAQMKTMANGDGRAGNWVSYQGGAASGKFATDNYEVEAQLIAPVGNTATDNYTGIVLAVADTFGGGGTGVMCYLLVSTGSGCQIVTQTGLPPTSGISTGQTGQTQRASVATNIAATDLIKIRRNGNVFTAYRNGSTFGLSWTDASNVVSSGSTNRRWGLIFEGNYPLFNAEFRSPAADAITSARDI